MTVEVLRSEFHAICDWLKKSIPDSLFVYNVLVVAQSKIVPTSENLRCFVDSLEKPTMAITVCWRKSDSAGYNFVEILVHFDAECDSDAKLKFIQCPKLHEAINSAKAPYFLMPYSSDDHEIFRKGFSTLGTYDFEQFGGENNDHVLTYLP